MLKKAQTKTDNSYLTEKIALRIKMLKDLNNIKVLDAFAGNGIIWDNIKRLTGKRIEVTELEIIRGKNRKAIEGDNLKILPTLNLSKFDVIDLDAYGSPYKQLKAVYLNKTRKKSIIYTTDIKSMMGRYPDELAEFANLTKEMIRKVPTLFEEKSEHGMINFLHSIGVKEYYEVRPEKRKIYRGFILEAI